MSGLYFDEIKEILPLQETGEDPVNHILCVFMCVYVREKKRERVCVHVRERETETESIFVSCPQKSEGHLSPFTLEFRQL